ncbi:sulfatase [Pararhizobium mangrovi]|uniref:Sulfatase n=1 Tax=Pararhizobium mangrovi TaxID=2590452 RepID=A0A506TYC6_9HYPH|nr:sulfatase [Pararhizobium mangrovi]TPW25971.1 sulfatase [Pararhizobium mangrovi]
MKVVFVLFDSLNRHMLGPYGGSTVATPNFDRLAEHSVTFDKHYVGSLPCMPARRDLLTGRLSFLHRSWGPMEPFDNAFPEMLAKKGVYSHLTTDHFHYFEDGGATYHNRYDSFDFVRGQEGDGWKAMVEPDWDRLRGKYHERQVSTDRRNYKAQNIVNREFIREEKDFPAVRVFDAGLDFIERNRQADDWLLQIETFDPHEPFNAPERFREAFPTDWDGPVRDWPPYGRFDELPGESDELRANYNASMASCDALLGRVLDAFDEHGMWEDTALVVTTDHGFLLGEHDFWAKNRMNVYEELAHIPLFVHDPRRQGHGGERRSGLTQTVDLAATFLDFFEVAPASEMTSRSVLPLIDGEDRLHDALLFGYFGGAVNVTDGHYSYHRFPADLATQEIYQYTLMPTHISAFFSTEELAGTQLADPFAFTKNTPLLKVPVGERSPMYDVYGPGALIEDETRLYDLKTDPGQERPLRDEETEARMADVMARLMKANDAPPEAFSRLELGEPAGEPA